MSAPTLAAMAAAPANPPRMADAADLSNTSRNVNDLGGVVASTGVAVVVVVVDDMIEYIKVTEKIKRI
jgi:hypothetical protein